MNIKKLLYTHRGKGMQKEAGEGGPASLSGANRGYNLRYFLWHPLHDVGAFLLASFLWQSLHIV